MDADRSRALHPSASIAHPRPVPSADVPAVAEELTSLLSGGHPHLEEHYDEPGFRRLWWNPPRDGARTLTASEVSETRRWLERTIAERVSRRSQIAAVDEGTREITWGVTSALGRRGYRTYTEVQFAHELVDGHGRVDVLALSPESPTLYIEIDSTPVALNLEKTIRKL